MSDFFSDLIDRHLGTCNVVEPRTPSRFETQGVGSAKPLAMDHSATGETGEEGQERHDRFVRLPENDPVVSPANSIEPKRTDPEIKSPVDHTHPVEAIGNYLGRQDDLIRLTANDSVPADGNALEKEPHQGAPLLRQQERQPVKPKPIEQTNSKQEKAPHQVIYRHSTVEIESRRTLPGDLPKRVSGRSPTEETHAHPPELGDRFEDGWDSRIRNMVARLQDPQKTRTTEHAKTTMSTRSVVTKAASTDNIEKEPAGRPLHAEPLFVESAKVGSSDSDQERPDAFASENRDISRDGSLEPPTWFPDMQAEFNHRWNELNRKPEPEPVVNVTIGRVEVRAVQPQNPQKTRRKKKPSAVMSLDAYLNQRKTRG